MRPPEGMSEKEYQALFTKKGEAFAEEIVPYVKAIIRVISSYGAEKIKKEIYEQVDHATR